MCVCVCVCVCVLCVHVRMFVLEVKGKTFSEALLLGFFGFFFFFFIQLGFHCAPGSVYILSTLLLLYGALSGSRWVYNAL